MAGFGGYDMGASQFAGGGFMPSPAPAHDAGFGMGGGKKQKREEQTLRAATIRQVLKENKGADDDFKVDGLDITLVTFVAKVVSLQENATSITLTVDDGTGRLDVEYFVNEDNQEVLNQSKYEWRAGAYVRLVGSVRAFQGKLGLRAYNIKAVTDHNEVTFHFLQCIFHRLHLTQGAPAAAAPAGAGAYGAPQAGYGGPQAGGFNSAPAAGGFNAPAPAQGGASGDISADVLAVYRENSHMEQGLHTDVVMQQLQARGANYTKEQVLNTVDFLTNEGHLFSTIDDNHHKTT